MKIVETRQLPPELTFFHGDGELQTLLRTFDWSCLPMGAPQTWPPEFLAMVQLMLVSSFPSAVTWGPAHYLLYNDAYAKILAHRHPQALGRRFEVVWPEIWQDELHPLFDNTFAGNPSHFEDVPFTISPDGISRQRWFSSSYSPIKNNAGTVIGLFNTAVETTSRVLAEKRQAFQLALTDRLRDLSRADDITAAASELLGRQLGVARVGYVEIDAATDTVHMKRDWTNGVLASMAGKCLPFDDFGPSIAGVLRAGQILVLNDVAADPRCAPYASAYAALDVGAALAIPLMKAGQLRAVLQIHQPGMHLWSEHDIALAEDMVERTWAAAERARAQAALRVERDQSQYIFDSMAEGFALLDQHWTVVRVNAEGLRITQRTAAEILGQNYWEVWPQQKNTEIESLYRQAMESGQAGTLERLHDLPDGTGIWIESRAYPSLDGGLAVFFRDITKRKQAQEQLKEADRRKDDFLAMLAHELRNPLAPIGAAAELLKLASLDEARVRRTSEVITRQVKHMTSLVDDLLDVSRVTRGLVALDKAPLALRHIVTDAVEQVTPLIEARRHHLALHLSPDATLLMGDKKRLVQVIANLLNNAAKYTQEGGNILLSTDVRQAHVLLRVQDDGIGMAPALVRRVFDLFAQAERSSDRSSGGLGLGLALVKSLAELHGGTVSCESEGIGKGSTFTLCLPRLIAASGATGVPPQQDAAAPAPVKPLRLLVVDDNADAAQMLAMYLEAIGHQVMVEHSSRRALERARIERPDVCLLDIGLPDMDGNELAQRLRAQPQTANSVLIAASGYGLEHDRAVALSAGFSHYLVKPVDTGALAALLAQIGSLQSL